MKIKISKSQWEGMGEKAGWIKKATGGGIRNNAISLESFAKSYKTHSQNFLSNASVLINNIPQQAKNILDTLVENKIQNPQLVGSLNIIINGGQQIRSMYDQKAFSASATPEQEAAIQKIVDAMATNASQVASMVFGDQTLGNL